MNNDSYNAIYDAAPSCMFYVKSQVTEKPATYRYEPLDVRGGPFGASSGLVTPHPPNVGDLVHLNEVEERRGGTYRVIDVARAYPTYRSQVWRIDNRWPHHGPMISIILVPAVGPFCDEADDVDDETS